MNLYTLKNGALSAQIAPEKGGTLVQLCRDGTDFLYMDGGNLESTERPRCGIPFLFPIFGRLKDRTYTWEGKAYHMDIHGFGHTSVWTVARAEADCLTLVLESSPETLAQYPFPFRVELTYRLTGEKLEILLSIRNTGSGILPYSFGFHPYFLVQDLDHARVEARAAARIDFATGKAIPFGHDTLSLSIPQGAPEAGAALVGLENPTVLHLAKEGRRITLEQDGSFPQLVLWTQAGKDFLCVEPVNGSADSLNTGNYLTLDPGQSRDITLTIHPQCI